MYLARVAVTFMDSCLTDALKLRATATFSRDIGELLPYLNAALDDSSYHSARQCLTITQGTRLIEVYPTWMTIARAANATDAFQLIQWLKDTVNRTYERRHELEPNLRYQHRAGVLELFHQLPLPIKNCGDCGDPTCMSFAARVWLGDATMAGCPHLTSRGETPVYQ